MTISCEFERSLAALDARMRTIVERCEGSALAADDSAGFGAAVAFYGEREPARATKPAAAVERLILSAARARGLDPAFLRAVVQVESAGDPLAHSSAGAAGLMQLMPGTARALGVADPYDPVQNIRGGADYLRSLLDRFGDARLAVAAYNAGPGAVERAHGIPPFRETEEYVRRVARAAAAFRAR